MARFDQQRDRPEDRRAATAGRSGAPPGRDLRASRQRFSRSRAVVLPAMSRRRSGPSLPAANQALAHNAVADLCNLLNWATATDEYEITQSPLRHLEPRGLIGTRVVRQRVLTKGKLRAVWSGADAMVYPHEGVFKLLILTGQRKDQVAGPQWSEIDFGEAEWRLTPERIKVRAAHRVPLAPVDLRLLRKLPVGPRTISLLASARR